MPLGIKLGTINNVRQLSGWNCDKQLAHRALVMVPVFPPESAYQGPVEVRFIMASTVVTVGRENSVPRPTPFLEQSQHFRPVTPLRDS